MGLPPIVDQLAPYDQHNEWIRSLFWRARWDEHGDFRGLFWHSDGDELLRFSWNLTKPCAKANRKKHKECLRLSWAHMTEQLLSQINIANQRADLWLWIHDRTPKLHWDQLLPIKSRERCQEYLGLFTIPKNITLSQTCLVQLPTPYYQHASTKIREVEKCVGRQNISFNARTPVVFYRGRDDRSVFRQREMIFNMGANEENFNWLNATKDYVSWCLSCQFRYQLDIGGASGTTWDALAWKLASGSLVFKVESGFVDSWHKHIKEWHHYVPVKSDMSDLRRMYKWAERNLEKSERIASKGARIAKRYFSFVNVKKAADEALGVLNSG